MPPKRKSKLSLRHKISFLFMRIATIPCLALFLACMACKNGPKNNSNVPAEADQTMSASAELPESFKNFYEKFHRDSLFQMAHIIWPLQGEKTVQTDSSSTEVIPHNWTPEEWLMHKPIDLGNGEFVREVSMMGDFMVIEVVKTRMYGYGIERRFAKQSDNDWALIYYSDMKQR